jgi:hypothetical protein
VPLSLWLHSSKNWPLREKPADTPCETRQVLIRRAGRS